MQNIKCRKGTTKQSELQKALFFQKRYFENNGMYIKNNNRQQLTVVKLNNLENNCKPDLNSENVCR